MLTGITHKDKLIEWYKEKKRHSQSQSPEATSMANTLPIQRSFCFCFISKLLKNIKYICTQIHTQVTKIKWQRLRDLVARTLIRWMAKKFK